jgi:hypothetical protein
VFIEGYATRTFSMASEGSTAESTNICHPSKNPLILFEFIRRLLSSSLRPADLSLIYLAKLGGSNRTGRA